MFRKIKNQKDIENAIYFITAVIMLVGFALAYYSRWNASGTILGINFNLFAYAGILGVSYLLFLLLFIIYRYQVKKNKISYEGNANNTNAYKVFSVILLTVFIIGALIYFY